MVANKRIFITAGIITLLLLSSIYAFNFWLNTQREEFVVDRMEEILDQYQEIQALSLMVDTFGTNITCLSMESSLSHLDKTLWDTGIKIERYQQVTEQFNTDPFYIEQKESFNRNEVIYFSMLKNMKEVCDFNQTVILYFYKKKEDCADCDAQAFVLTDLNKEIDPEIAIFSFDSNLGLPSINTLERYYEIEEYPCLIVEDTKYCGLKNKNQIIEILCEYRDHSLCSA